MRAATPDYSVSTSCSPFFDAALSGIPATCSNRADFSGIIPRRVGFPASRANEMTLHKNLGIFVVAAIGLAASASALAVEGNAAAGKEKTFMCTGCHGIDMYRTAFPAVYHVPKLGGQHAAYIIKALQEYKSGDRTHPSMRAIAASLSDQDMADLAAYYSSKTTAAK